MKVPGPQSRRRLSPPSTRPRQLTATSPHSPPSSVSSDRPVRSGPWLSRHPPHPVPTAESCAALLPHSVLKLPKMSETGGRLLRLLSVLQQRPVWRGEELAERVEVTLRTLLDVPRHAGNANACGSTPQQCRGRPRNETSNHSDSFTPDVVGTSSRETSASASGAPTGWTASSRAPEPDTDSKSPRRRTRLRS